ncbi:hypothetical protein GM182_00330 [bacterium 3DAC]|nr:hypothetical protein GM182_00330 [bacterium 3DAC]
MPDYKWEPEVERFLREHGIDPNNPRGKTNSLKSTSLERKTNSIDNKHEDKKCSCVRVSIDNVFIHSFIAGIGFTLGAILTWFVVTILWGTAILSYISHLLSRLPH